MPKRSSGSAEIRLPSREVLIQSLKCKTDQMLKDFDEVEEAILFGSLARGDHEIYSDADVLVILSDSPYERYFDRIPKYTSAFAEFDMSVEVFPYTRAELSRMRESGNLFIKSILQEGISLSKR
jgi:predicted nucleotidyltransferase